jgi:hypothetical protein
MTAPRILHTGVKNRMLRWTGNTYQHQTTEAGPPSRNGVSKVVLILLHIPCDEQDQWVGFRTVDRVP